jgi:glycerol-3-phosphate dehydrogenase
MVDRQRGSIHAAVGAVVGVNPTLEDRIDDDHPDVLIVGGGINGAGLIRDLALQGVSVLLVEKGDFCSGSSAAPSRMIHGGLRYLEYGETRLVRESLHERDALMRNAPHYVRPIETVMPLFSWFKGLFSAPVKFLRGKGRPTERGAVVVMIGLTFYDIFTRASRMVPKRSFASRTKTLQTLPDLDANIVGSATYWDGQISYPERLALELITDAEAASSRATALNYVSFVQLDGEDGVVVRDEISGERVTVRPRVVVNASGGWIDLTNAAMGAETRSIDGVKGSHLVIDDPELVDVLDDRLVYYENSEKRICIVFPWQGKVLAGSTEIPLSDPDQAICTPQEQRYILDSLAELFPGRSIDPGAIVSTFSGVRPLTAGNGASANEISRDHSCARVDAPGSSLPIYSMVGGKWTTFRSFAALTADAALSELSLVRKVATDDLPIGGGRGYPAVGPRRDAWLRDLSDRFGITTERATDLLDRYGTQAVRVAEYAADGSDRPLAECADYTEAEIRWFLAFEKVRRLDDIVLRRTNLALLGMVTTPLLDELSQLLATHLGLSEPERVDAVASTAELLQQRYGITIKEGQPS